MSGPFVAINNMLNETKQFRIKGKQRDEEENEQIEEKALKKKGSRKVGGGADNPPHKVYIVLCFILLCYNNIRGNGIDQDLARKAISINTMKITIFFKKTF